MTDFTPTPDGPGYGLGLFEYTVAGHTGIGHTGGIHGYESVAMLLPESGEVLVALANDHDVTLIHVVETLLSTP